MEWKIWITWWILFCVRYSKLFWIYLKQKRDSYSLIMIYVNKNRRQFEINTGYYLELLTPETMKLLGRTKSKITEKKNGKNVLHLEVTEGSSINRL